MSWVGAPIRAQFYTVRSGDGCMFCDGEGDPTSYVPDEYMTIYIRNLDYFLKYRGLLMHANARNNRAVGEWEIPEDDLSPVHTPCSNPSVLLHTGASEKSSLVKVRWKAPPAGTGTVVFKVLFKFGPANGGEFYWPQHELVLEEGIAEMPQVWVQGDDSESCDDACGRVDQQCSQGEISMILFMLIYFSTQLKTSSFDSVYSIQAYCLFVFHDIDVCLNIYFFIYIYMGFVVFVV